MNATVIVSKHHSAQGKFVSRDGDNATIELDGRLITGRLPNPKA